MKNHLAVLTLTIAACVPTSVFAQATDYSEEVVVVTASRTEKPLSTIPNTVTVINQQELDRQISINTDMSTILGNLVPSFSPSRQKLTSYGESLRGRDPLYLVDGVPQSNPLRDGSRDGYTIDPLMLERVEIIHGANAIHGLGASGGIINLITKRPENALTQSFRVESFAQDADTDDSFGYGANYNLSNAWDSADLLLGVGYRSTGIGYDADGDIIGFDSAQGDTMDAEMINLFLKTGYQWNDQRIELTVNHFDISGNNDWITIPGNTETGIPTTSEEGEVPGDEASNEVTLLSVNYSHAQFLGQELRVQVFDQDFAATYGGGIYGTFQDPAYAPAGELFDQSQNNSEKQGAKITLVLQGDGDYASSLVYGIDFLEDKTYQQLVQTGRNWVPETNYENIALFAQFETTFIERITATAGLRHERSDLVVDDFSTLASYGGQFVVGGNPDFSETLYNVGATYQLSNAWRLFANYSEGFSMPDVGRVLRGIDEPGQDVETFLGLEPIITENIEAGVEYNSAEFSAQLSFYASDADFGQRLQANADGIYSVQREKTEIEGFEFRGEWLASTVDVFGLRYANTDGEYDSDDDGSVDTDLSGANMSPNRLNLSWDRAWTEKFSTRVQINHLFDRDFKDMNGNTTSNFHGYTTIDASGDWLVGQGSLRLGLQNLTNEDYFTYYSQTLGNNSRNFKGLGRSLSLSYRFQF